MTSRQLTELRRLARLGRSLLEIGRACRISKQRVHQVLTDLGALSDWRIRRSRELTIAAAMRRQAKIDAFLRTTAGEILDAVGYRLGKGHEFAPVGRKVYGYVGVERVRMRLSHLRSPKRTHPSARVRYYVANAGPTWSVNVLPDNRVVVFAPEPHQRHVYIPEDASASWLPASQPVLAWTHGQRRAA